MSVALEKNYNALFTGDITSSTMRLDSEYVKDNTDQKYELRYDPNTGTSAIVGYKEVITRTGTSVRGGVTRSYETTVLFESTPDGGSFTEKGRALLDSGQLLTIDGNSWNEQTLRNTIQNDVTSAYNRTRSRRNSQRRGASGLETIDTSTRVSGTAGGEEQVSRVEADPDQPPVATVPTDAGGEKTDAEPRQNASAGKDEENNLANTVLKKFGVDIKTFEKLLFKAPTEEQLRKIRESFSNSDASISQIAGLGIKYPIDALFGGANSQDYVNISQYVYKPPGSNVIFNPKPATLLTQGAQRVSPLQQKLGYVKLPMPNDVTDSNNVSWGEDAINNLSAAITSAVTTNPSTVAGGAALGGLISALTGVDGFGKIGALAGIFGNAGGLGAAGGILQNDNAQMVIGSAVSSRLLSLGGVNVSPEALLSRGYGVVPNMNMELLFNSPTLRKFVFNWKLAARDDFEAMQINKIIRFFKQGMAAKTQTDQAGGSTLLLGTPNIFKLRFMTRTGGDGRFNNNGEIMGVGRIKECAITGCSVNYTPEGKWAAYDDGQPVSVILTLRMEELEPIYASDYIGGNDAQGRPDYNPISLNDVGY